MVQRRSERLRWPVAPVVGGRPQLAARLGPDHDTEAEGPDRRSHPGHVGVRRGLGERCHGGSAGGSPPGAHRPPGTSPPGPGGRPALGPRGQAVRPTARGAGDCRDHRGRAGGDRPWPRDQDGVHRPDRDPADRGPGFARRCRSRLLAPGAPPGGGACGSTLAVAGAHAGDGCRAAGPSMDTARTVAVPSAAASVGRPQTPRASAQASTATGDGCSRVTTVNCGGTSTCRVNR